MHVIDYKCQSCGSSMTFNGVSGMLSCGSCGRADNIEQIPDPLQESNTNTTTNTTTNANRNEAAQYSCNSCGAAIVADEETSATVCSFCGSSAVLANRLWGRLQPTVVLPFSINRDTATKAFRKWCRNGLLTPKGFMAADRIKSIAGMYVPFWLYGLDNKVNVTARATKVRIYTQGDYQYTETSHFEVYRHLRINYNRVPIDASNKMNDKLMDMLEPFPYERLKNFRSPYLAGFYAEKYNENEDQLLPRAKRKVEPFIEDYIRSTMPGYTTVNYTDKRIDSRMEAAEFALLPVWVLHYDYDKLEHTFAMNGQTGTISGKPPISMGKVAAWFVGISGVSLLALKCISWSMGGGFW